MASNSIIEVRIDAPDNVLEVEVGTVEVDVPRSVGYYGGLAVAVGIGLIEPPLALFIAAVPVFKVLPNTALPPLVRAARRGGQTRWQRCRGRHPPEGSAANPNQSHQTFAATGPGPITPSNMRPTAAWLADPDPTELFEILANVPEA